VANNGLFFIVIENLLILTKTQFLNLLRQLIQIIMTDKKQKPESLNQTEKQDKSEVVSAASNKVIPTPVKPSPAPQKLMAQRMNNPRPKIQQRSPRGR
jgi:hypothetical protein